LNKIFISGIITEEIEYKFMISKKHSAIAMFKIETYEKQIMEVIAYDDIADFALRRIKKSMLVYVEGSINSKMEIVAKHITYLMQF
jgi:single-stranded DNA-binding protein